jgi:hypothetical protein
MLQEAESVIRDKDAVANVNLQPPRSGSTGTSLTFRMGV